MASTATNPAPSAPPECTLPHCEELAGNACCTSSTTPHYLCDSCFCGYATTQFEPVGAFENERVSPNGGGIVSAPGELPCFLFLTGECDCPSIPRTMLAQILSTDEIALEAWESAKRRLHQAQHEQERQETDAAQTQRAQEATPVDRLKLLVEDVLNRGGYVACPSCGQHGQKNDACMHMTCPACQTRFCYCCGRQRDNAGGPRHCASNGSGCDYPSPYLENHPGWNGFAKDNESAGTGALNEFHRRRMAYFLRQVKTNQTTELWEAFQQENSTILQDKPTDGRCIQWNEIDVATAPTFNRTTVDQLEWENEGLLAVQEACCTEPACPEQAPDRGPDPPEPHLSECFLLEHPYVTLWLVGFILAVVLLSARVSSDSEALRIMGILLAAALAGTGLPTVAKFAVDKIATNNTYCIREVQCLRGRNYELPYLASEGRWFDWRDFYWYLFFCGIALATVCLTNRSIPSLHVIGVTLLTAIVLFYGSITILVNVEEPPTRQPLRSQFKHSIIRLSIFGVLLSIGIGMLAVHDTVYDTGSIGDVAGKVVFALGLSGVFAETLPRFHQRFHGGESFISTPDTYRLVLSYVICLGVTIGALMLRLSESYPIVIAGKAILLVSIFGSLTCYCCCIRDRPLVRQRGR